MLCKDCHRRQPHHEGIFVSHSEMQIITEQRRKDGTLEGCDWTEVFSLSDPSVHGDLHMFKREGYAVPVIGHEVQGRVAMLSLRLRRLGLSVGRV